MRKNVIWGGMIALAVVTGCAPKVAHINVNLTTAPLCQAIIKVEDAAFPYDYRLNIETEWHYWWLEGLAEEARCK